MADIKKFLDQGGVSTLWGKIATNLKAEEDRAKLAEEAAAAAAKKAQDEVDALETYVGTIPANYTESNIVAFIQKRAEEVLTAAQGGSSETAASVKAALDTHKAENEASFKAVNDSIDAIVADYLKAADKTELAGLISTNADEIARVDAALKLAVENNEEGIDSIKELATWVNTHGTEAAGYSAAISALEALVGDTAVATQIANAIAAEHLEQFAKTADIEGTLAKVDTEGSVTAAINAAIAALKISDYATSADLVALAAEVTALENAGHQNAEQVAAAIDAKIAALNLAETYDAKGAAADALTAANSYTDAEIAKIQALTPEDIEAAIAAAASQGE